MYVIQWNDAYLIRTCNPAPLLSTHIINIFAPRLDPFLPFKSVPIDRSSICIQNIRLSSPNLVNWDMTFSLSVNSTAQEEFASQARTHIWWCTLTDIVAEMLHLCLSFHLQANFVDLQSTRMRFQTTSWGSMKKSSTAWTSIFQVREETKMN